MYMWNKRDKLPWSHIISLKDNFEWRATICDSAKAFPWIQIEFPIDHNYFPSIPMKILHVLPITLHLHEQSRSKTTSLQRHFPQLFWSYWVEQCLKLFVVICKNVRYKYFLGAFDGAPSRVESSRRIRLLQKSAHAISNAWNFFKWAVTLTSIDGLNVRSISYWMPFTVGRLLARR